MPPFDYSWWCGRLYVALIAQAPDSKTAAEYEQALAQHEPGMAEIFPFFRNVVTPRESDDVEGYTRP